MQARPRTDSQEGMRESFGELLGQLANHSAALVRDEMDLARQELMDIARSLRRGVTAIALGVLIGLIALATLAAAAVIGLAHVMDAGYSALIVGGALGVLGGSIAAAGIKRLKRTTLTPEQTMETLEEDKQWLKQLT